MWERSYVNYHIDILRGEPTKVSCGNDGFMETATVVKNEACSTETDGTHASIDDSEGTGRHMSEAEMDG